jgi:hypothetical protein
MKLLNKDVILFPDGPLSVQVGEKSTQRRSQRVFDTRSGFRPPRAARQKARFGTNYLVVNAHGALILLERKVSEGDPVTLLKSSNRRTAAVWRRLSRPSAIRETGDRYRICEAFTAVLAYRVSALPEASFRHR